MPTVRERSNGTFELRVIHKALHKPFYSTHDSDTDARTYASKLVAALDRGDVPPELRAPTGEPRTMLADVLKAYIRDGVIAASDMPMVESLRDTVEGTVEGVTVRWTDTWISDLKKQRLAPGTIRKKVESLARAIDWWNRREHDKDSMPANPLRMLPKGYSTYRDVDGEAKHDVERDRRLRKGEAARIEKVIMEDPSIRFDRVKFLLLWRLIVNTGMRLREAYKLRKVDVKFKLKTIHVPKGKTRVREIPMTREVYGWLKEAEPLGTLVFPFWDGTDEDLPRCTSRLSQTFARVFELAGCKDITEHDLRHEATCRWMLLEDESGRWMFRSEEVMRITGHRTDRTFRRYLSLRGSDLAERLWA